MNQRLIFFCVTLATATSTGFPLVCDVFDLESVFFGLGVLLRSQVNDRLGLFRLEQIFNRGLGLYWGLLLNFFNDQGFRFGYWLRMEIGV